MTPNEIIEAGNLMREYGESVLAGKPIEIEYSNINAKIWYSTLDVPIWDFNNSRYRRKPKQEMVPLEPQDVPHFSVIRMQGWDLDSYVCVLAVGPTTVTVLDYSSELPSPKKWTYKELKNCESLISRDGGKTWSKCEKPRA